MALGLQGLAGVMLALCMHKDEELKRSLSLNHPCNPLHPLHVAYYLMVGIVIQNWRKRS